MDEPPANGNGGRQTAEPTKKNACPTDNRTGSEGQGGEPRRNDALCFPVKKKLSWQTDFAGVVTLDDGRKFWVNLYKKLDRHGKAYVLCKLVPWRERARQ